MLTIFVKRSLIASTKYTSASGRYSETEVVTRKCSVKKVLLKISQNSQEKPLPEPPF